MSASDQAAGDERKPGAMPTHLKVTLRGVAGGVFKAEEPHALCFVPEQFIRVVPTGGVEINEVGYVASGWGTRNLRRTGAEIPGHFLFPDVAAGLLDPAEPEVARFLGRFG